MDVHTDDYFIRHVGPIIAAATVEAASSRSSEVATGHVLLALLTSGESGVPDGAELAERVRADVAALEDQAPPVSEHSDGNLRRFRSRPAEQSTLALSGAAERCLSEMGLMDTGDSTLASLLRCLLTQEPRLRAILASAGADERSLPDS